MGRSSTAQRRLMDAASTLFWESNYSGTTIDDICQRAEVRKGTFYHFYKNKLDLSVAALEDWRSRRTQTLKHIFRREAPPLFRLLDYFDFALQRQTQHYIRTGRVLGCPIFSLACEISTQEESLRQITSGMLHTLIGFFESALRDAQGQGDVELDDPIEMARIVYYMWEATLTQCRIENDLEALRELPNRVKKLVGATDPALWEPKSLFRDGSEYTREELPELS